MGLDVTYLLFALEKAHATTRLNSVYRENQRIEKNIVELGLSVRGFIKPIEIKSKLVERIENYKNIVNPDFDETPNELAIEIAKKLLISFNDFDITPRVNPSDGGVIFEFFKEDKYYLLEAFNSGDIFFLERDGDNDNIKKHSLTEAKERIELIFDGELQVY